MIVADSATHTGRRTTYAGQIAALMLCAFVLSVTHTVYSWAVGIDVPDFTVTTPLTWGFYIVAFAMTILARRAERWAQLVVPGYLLLLLLIGIFYYPSTFGPRQQTTFGWFENDVYLGLLMVALYLSIMRLRSVSLVPRR